MQWLKELSSDTLRAKGEWIDVIYGIEFQAIDEWELDKLIEIDRESRMSCVDDELTAAKFKIAINQHGNRSHYSLRGCFKFKFPQFIKSPKSHVQRLRCPSAIIVITLSWSLFHLPHFRKLFSMEIFKPLDGKKKSYLNFVRAGWMGSSWCFCLNFQILHSINLHF